jgi:hypothetical protein
LLGFEGGGFGGEGTNLGHVEISREQTPVEVGAIADVRVVAVACG